MISRTALKIFYAVTLGWLCGFTLDIHYSRKHHVRYFSIYFYAYLYELHKLFRLYTYFFFFFDNRQYIFQRQPETNTEGASSLQAKATEVGSKLRPEEKEKPESSVYFAAS